MKLIKVRKSLKFNFGRRSIKKLVKDYVRRTSGYHVRKVESYFIEVDTKNIMVISRPSKEVVIKKLKAIKKKINRNDLIDTINIKTF